VAGPGVETGQGWQASCSGPAQPSMIRGTASETTLEMYSADDRPTVWMMQNVGFLALQHSIMLSALYASARPSVRVSVCLSVRLSVTRMDQSKMVEVRVVKFSPYDSPL